MTSYSLMATILRYRAGHLTYLAECAEADERGETDEPVRRDEAAMKVLEAWDRPADGLDEAIAALILAMDDYAVGETPRIPAMMKAVLGWMEVEFSRRREA